MVAADLTFNRLAVGQHGLVTRAQAGALGLTPRQIDRRVNCGVLVAVHRGVYRLGGVPITREQRILGACLAAGPSAVASHRAAAVLWDLRGATSPRPEISVGGSARPLLDGVIVHRSSVDSVDRGRHGPIPVTRPARTLLDLAAVDPRVVEGALDDALVRGVTNLGALERLLDRCGARGRAGTALLRELVADRFDGRASTESPLEDAVVGVLRRQGLPEPVRQHPVRFPDGKVVRIDLAYPDELVAIEADGRRWHAGLADSRRDHRRDVSLVTLGWAVLRYGWSDLGRGRELAAEVRACRQRSTVPRRLSYR